MPPMLVVLQAADGRFAPHPPTASHTLKEKRVIEARYTWYGLEAGRTSAPRLYRF